MSNDKLPNGWIVVDGKDYVPIEEAAHLAANQCLYGLRGDEGGNSYCPEVLKQAATIKQSGERIAELETLVSDMFDWCKCGYVHNTRMPVDGGLIMLAKAKSIRDKKEVTPEDIRKWLH